ncbi:MAG: 30S ribosomal protein S16 [Epsilonproteobacteria bacterium]|nr:30S ribosomal protein S16 [Campylobacterota bacterium]
MVKIRLARFGRKKRPFYRIVVTDSRKRRDSGWIEIIGYYNPLTDPKTIEIKKDRLDYWLGVGAKMSERVEKLKKIYEERQNG